ncbi:MAG: tetratricopeptide repeat protein [Pseudomonadota bacterium]
MSHYDDEDQAQRVKQWWKDNWMALAAGLVLGLSGIFGWQQYKSHQLNQSAEAARMFDDLKTALLTDKVEDANSIANKLKSDFAKTPYAAQALMRIAQHAVEKSRFDEALPPLAWVADNAEDEALRPLAKMRQARVLSQQGKFDDALKLLDAKMDESYAALAQELRGDILLTQGNRKGARESFEKALATSDETAANRETLQRKIDDLADAA